MYKKTIYRVLNDAGIINWRAKKRLLFTEEYVYQRLAWAIEYKDWIREEWSKIIWSDECSVERGSGKRREWVFRILSQKWDKEMIQGVPKGKDISVMIWAAFWGAGRSDIYALERDFEAKKHGYSANSYIQVLEDNLIDIYNPDLIFMQDNAAIHTAHKTRLWFETHGVHVMTWPPYSPDLNSIEYLWWKLKSLLNKEHPELMDLPKNSDRTRVAMAEALKEVYTMVDQDLIDNLIDSMTTRVNEVLAAEGWYTRF